MFSPRKSLPSLSFPIHPKVQSFLDETFAPQRSAEWLKARENILTCSELPAILGENKYESPERAFQKKTGQIVFYGNWMTRYGNEMEDEAAKYYELVTGDTCIELGLCIHKTIPWIGGSPDRIALHSGKLVEIKCPPKRPIDDVIPSHYYSQIQGLLFVLDLDECDFVQYRPVPGENPVFSLVSVKRDDTWFETHKDTLYSFYTRVQEYRYQKRKTQCAIRCFLRLCILYSYSPTFELQQDISTVLDLYYATKPPSIPKKRKKTVISIN